jgi:hypothetical protein
VELADRSLRKWQRFTASLDALDPIHVFDAHLIHWDFTTLLLADSDPRLIWEYAAALFGVVSGANPVFVYLHQADPEQALRRIAAARGDGWLEKQLSSKLVSPYCQRRGMVGLPGWIQLYQEYRGWADDLVACNGLHTLAIDTSRGRWRAYKETGPRIPPDPACARLGVDHADVAPQAVRENNKPPERRRAVASFTQP